MNEETLTINDLLQIQKIIDVAVQRGAFKVDESRIVGETYEKIAAFLNSLDATDNTTTDSEPTEENSQND